MGQSERSKPRLPYADASATDVPGARLNHRWSPMKSDRLTLDSHAGSLVLICGESWFGSPELNRGE